MYWHKKEKTVAGFSLLEISIGMIIVGMLMVSGMSLYNGHLKQQQYAITEARISDTRDNISAFSVVYGRYPCPASSTAVPGDLDYGFELSDCLTTGPAIGSCANGLCTYASNIGGQAVIVGSLPFKTLNIQEFDSYDTYQMRLRYAVTLDMTDEDSFDMAGGGIGIVDQANPSLSLVSPNDRAHFVIISSGPNRIGAVTRTGNVASVCTLGSAGEQENCDGDSVFASGEYDGSYDDRTRFFSSVLPTEWKRTAPGSSLIYLKDSDSIAIGALVTSDLSNKNELDVLNNGADNGTVIAEGDIYVERLCEEGATSSSDCFQPKLLSGNLSGSNPEELISSGAEGMSCYDGMTTKYLVGIENGGPICREEIFMSCPSDSFIAAVEGGKVKCNGLPPPSCSAMEVPTTCGPDRTLPSVTQGNYSAVYSGECRKLPSPPATYFKDKLIAALPNIDLIYAAAAGNRTTLKELLSNVVGVDALNSQPRVIEDCGPNHDTGLVKDIYQCNDSTSWEYKHAHERIKLSASQAFSEPPNSTDSRAMAETSYTGEDLDNNNSYHDCWCREDYRIALEVCGNNSDRDKILIQKHQCPQTEHVWSPVITLSNLCTCVDGGQASKTMSCNAYYDLEKGTTGTNGLDGNVNVTYTTACADPTTAIFDPQNITNVSGLNNCTCKSNSDAISDNLCLPGHKNSWTSPFGARTDVASVSEKKWVCPATSLTTAYGNIPNPGYFQSPIVHPGPTCTCDSSDFILEDIACPDPMTEGPGTQFKRFYNCVLGQFEPDPNQWLQVSTTKCSPCKVVRSEIAIGDGTAQDVGLGYNVGTSCTCTDNISLCHVGAGQNASGNPLYKNYSNCLCTSGENF